MAQEKWNVEELPEEQQSILKSLYGPQPSQETTNYAANRILFARELTKYEKRIFANKAFMSPGFLTQRLYKLKGILTPLRFNRVMHTLMEESEILRTNYCPMGMETLAVVFERRKDLPQIVYQNMESLDSEELDSRLRKAMEADMREGFDLRHGHLLRFSVFHTALDEYAVLVTMAQAILDRVDIRKLFCDVQGMEPLQTQEEQMASMDMAAQHSRMETSMRDYWSRMLSDLPEASIVPYTRMPRPGEDDRQRVYHRRIPPDIMSDIREKAKSNRMMLMAILQTAWGLILQDANACRDVCFCLLVTDRKEKEMPGVTSGAGFNMMPVRFRSPGELTVRKLVSQQFQQIMVSQPYSCFDWEDMRELAGERMFDHFLSFYDFMVEEQKYSEIPAEPGGAFVARNSWDAQGTRLGVYFQYGEQSVSFSLMYDENRVMPSGDLLLANRYLFVLQQMLTDWNLPMDSFMERLEKRLDMDKEAEAERHKEDRAARVQDVLSRLRLLQGTGSGFLQEFMGKSHLETMFEGDRISGAIMEENLIFIVAGKLARSIEAGDGWYNTLDILKEGDWANETIMLSDKKSHFSVEVLTEEAEVLLYPLSKMNDLMVKYPQLGKNMVQHLARQMEKYQRLWVQS